MSLLHTQIMKIIVRLSEQSLESCYLLYYLTAMYT